MSHYKPDPNKTVNLTIDGLAVTVPEGTRILEAAQKVGIKIPTLCDHPDLCKRAVCRLCVVECDGRRKLSAACATDVSEGLSVVTYNERIVSIRKMVLELVLANHPLECLTCVRSKHCELQTLAANYGIREPAFRHDPQSRRPPVSESKTLVRDMGKCVKCGRCVETCQEVQTVRNLNSSHRGVHYDISVPYNQSLEDGDCVFCGQCAKYCPVGAIYEYEQTTEAWSVLNNKDRFVAAQLNPTFCELFDEALNLPPGTISPGKVITAMKSIGFNKVFNKNIFTDAVAVGRSRALMDRIAKGGKLPLVEGCSQGWTRFAKKFYPDLMEHVMPYNPPQQMFGGMIHLLYPESIEMSAAGITTISIEPCIAKKFRVQHDEHPFNDVDMVLTVKELALMFNQASINVAGLPETPFDVLMGGYGKTGEEMPWWKEFSAVPGQEGIEEAVITINGTKMKFLIAHGLVSAHKIMESIRDNKCDAAFVEIKSCPGSSLCTTTSFRLIDALHKL